MVIFGRWKALSVTISSKPNTITVSLSGASSSDVFSFDGEGRLWTAMLSGISYRRGLNGKTVAKWDEQSGKNRRWLSTDETGQLQEKARLTVEQLRNAITAGQADINEQPPAEAMQQLQKAANFDSASYLSDTGQYHQVYKPVGILPPDQYMAVVLQLTEGCSFNTCTFCNFYRDRPFRIKTPSEFRDHARAVKNFLGEGLKLRRTIFLGDANALVVPTARLLPLLDTVHQVYDVEALGGLYAFLDGFSGEKKSAADFQEVAARGMKRIYIGMESGNPELLSYLKKPGHPEDVLAAVQAMKTAGISVGIIVLLGAGGFSFARRHVDDTVRLINQMNLDLDDLIYFSELIESEGIPYVQDAYHANLQPMTSADRIKQGEEIENRLIFPPENGVPHISRYDIREFVY